MFLLCKGLSVAEISAMNEDGDSDEEHGSCSHLTAMLIPLKILETQMEEGY